MSDITILLTWGQLSVLLVSTGAVVFGVLKWFIVRTNTGIDGFLEQKAKNLATHQDIQKLVDQVKETEQVKAEIADRMWDRQVQWNTKRDRYVALVSELTHLITLQNTLREVLQKDLKQERHRQEVLQTLDQMGEHGNKLADSINVSRLFVSDSVIQAFMAVTNSWGDILKAAEADWNVDLSEKWGKTRERLMDFINVAKKDLGYEVTTGILTQSRER